MVGILSNGGHGGGRIDEGTGPERHRRLARLMGMGTWQKSEDYGLEITRIRSGSDERTSSPVSPASVVCGATCVAKPWMASEGLDSCMVSETLVSLASLSEIQAKLAK